MMEFVITGAAVFDGEDVRAGASVLVRGSEIVAVGAAGEVAVPVGAEVIDGRGMTLLPGLIDTHTHAKPPVLETSLAFGVTTECDMLAYPEWMVDYRAEAQVRNDMADVRSAMYAVTVAGGHPAAMVGRYFPHDFPVISSVEDVPGFVAARVAEGADYIKLMIDDGTSADAEQPTMTPAMVDAVVRETHRHGLMAIAHATSLAETREAVRAGVDGLAHVFRDVAPTEEIVEEIRASGIFVVPTLVMNGDLTGTLTGEELIDERTRPFLSPAEQENLCACWPGHDPEKYDHAADVTAALYAAGVDLLAGTDVVGVGLYGSAHGVSLHQELRLLVDAGMAPRDVLRGATSLAARRFGFHDRGRIAPGLQADLVLVDGDPLTTITDSLSIAGVWRRGERFDREAFAARVAEHDELATA